MKSIFAIALFTAGASYAGMITDPVSSSLTLSGGGSWTSGSSAIVGPGVEFSQVTSLGGFNLTLSLDIADSKFTLTDVDPATNGGLNLGLDAFQFTDLNQNFAGITLEGGNTWPANTFTGSSVTAHTIQITMNEKTIQSGNSWSATWDVTFANPTPEPGSIALFATGLAALGFAARFRRRAR